MKKVPIPKFEKKRLESVKKLKILDTEPEEWFDQITKKATEEFNTPISTISIVDKNREWYKSKQGVDVIEGPRDKSFCGHAMLGQEIFIVEDTTKDPRFADNPMVVGLPKIRFYAGVALHECESHLPIGAFCIKDTKPRKLTLSQINRLIETAKKIEEELNKKNTP